MSVARSSLQNRRAAITRFALAGAVLGLAVGVVEAAILFFIPWVPTLFETDVSYVIWLLAPLIDLILYALLGALIGYLVSLGGAPSAGRGVILAAALLGVAGAHIGWLLALVHVWGGDQEVLTKLATPTAWFASVFAGALLLARIFQPHALRLFDAGATWPIRFLTKATLGAVGLQILGLGVYLSRGVDVFESSRAGAPEDVGKPNIVLISLDTVRADHLSLYGYARPTSRNLERIARQGLVFENAIAPSSWTLAAHASMFTGCLPHQHGASWGTPLDGSLRTVAEVLASHGYETVGFTSNLHYGQRAWGIGQGFQHYEDDSYSVRHNLAATLVGRELAQPLYHRVVRDDRFDRRNAEELNRDVIRWFHRRSPRPFFLFVNYLDAHSPYLAPPPYQRRFGEISKAAIDEMNAMKGLRIPPPVPPDRQESLIAGYDNCLAYLDDKVGRLLDFLSASREWSNTIIIITADHGEAFGEHGSYGHEWNLHREILHVPLIFIGPGIPAGLRITPIAPTRQLFPTLIDLALGEAVPLGRLSLRRFWTPGYQPLPGDDTAVSELIQNAGVETRTASASLMTSRWQCIHDSSGRAELYQWNADPQEKLDLSADPKYDQTLHSLHVLLQGMLGTSLRPWRGPEYLFALDQPGYSFQREALFGEAFHSPPSPHDRPVGTAQALFAPDASATPKPLPPDVDLVNSLPYH